MSQEGGEGQRCSRKRSLCRNDDLEREWKRFSAQGEGLASARMASVPGNRRRQEEMDSTHSL